MKILDFIAAEDIRTEVGNKHSLIGIYNDKVELQVPPEFIGPYPFRLAIYIRIDKEGNQAPIDCVRLNILHNGNLTIPIEATAGPKSESAYIIMAANINPYPLPGPGILEFDLQIVSNGEIIFSEQSPPINITTQSPAITTN